MNRTAFHSTRRYAAGYSLVEIIIVLAISGVMIVAMLQAMLGIRQYASTAEVQDDLNIEAQRVLAIIREDLGASGWYLPVGEVDPLKITDRDALFFPYIQIQQTGKLGTRFPHHDRVAYAATKDWLTVTHYPGLPGSAADWNATALNATQYRTSYYARSQEVIFLKVLKGSFNPNGTQPILEPVDFKDYNGVTYAMPGNHVALGVRTMSQWDRGTDWDVTKRNWYLPSGSTKIYDAEASGLWLRTATSDDGAKMPLRWETMTRYPNLTTIAGGAPFINLREIREFCYAVVPNPAAGNRGQLVRAYKKPINDIKDTAANTTFGVAATDWVISSGNYQPDVSAAAMPSAMVVERVISDKVDRITFDTFRTDQLPNPNYPATPLAKEFISGLEINQIRVRLFLSKRGTVDIGAVQHLVVEATISMRSTSDTNAINDLESQLGDGGTVIIH